LCRTFGPARTPPSKDSANYLSLFTNTTVETRHNDLLCLQWPTAPRNVLLTKKNLSPTVTDSLIEYARHIQSSYPSVSLILEPDAAEEVHKHLVSPIYSVCGGEKPSSVFADKVDLVSTLGGDGTILHASSLFATQSHVPPILSFSMGTLGFLGEWKFAEYKRAFREVFMSGANDGYGSVISGDGTNTALDRGTGDPTTSISTNAAPSDNAKPTGWSSIRGKSMGPNRGARVLLRNRLKVGVFGPDGSRVGSDNAAVSGEEEDVYAMNEVIIHRGRDPHLTIVDLFVGGRYLTESVADGMIISTPTGSTAYSLSSGGSIVHPLVSSLLITPICPRSLSFRPLVLPANTPITMRLSEKNRGRQVEVSIDGVPRSQTLGVGMEVRVWGEDIRDRQGNWVGGVPSIVRGAVGTEYGNEDNWVGGLNGLLKFNYPFGEEDSGVPGQR